MYNKASYQSRIFFSIDFAESDDIKILKTKNRGVASSFLTYAYFEKA